MKRVQVRRGVALPAGTKYVGRPTRWGNRWVIGMPCDHSVCATGRVTREDAIREYRADLLNLPAVVLAVHLDPLRGHDLACYCPLDLPCHVDVLLELLA